MHSVSHEAVTAPKSTWGVGRLAYRSVFSLTAGQRCELPALAGPEGATTGIFAIRHDLGGHVR